MVTRKSSSKQVYQLKITLRDMSPPIWRRVQVLDNISLEKLHWIIQLSMGWTNSHLHAFETKDGHYSLPIYELGMSDERKVKLSQIVKGEKFKFSYEYDFGDSWDHTILVEKVLPVDPKTSYPICIKGKRACPPEDVGGIWGYGCILEAIANPEDPEYEEYLDWIDEDFDPEFFSIDEVNQALANLKK